MNVGDQLLIKGTVVNAQDRGNVIVQIGSATLRIPLAELESLAVLEEAVVVTRIEVPSAWQEPPPTEPEGEPRTEPSSGSEAP